jgi:2-polyprenyl-6-methoxyphenol hydroxylase-like FAD-dependent oxidoreductase
MLPTAPEYDVAIVGYGPVGEMAALMLARRGYRVAVVERWTEIYPLPRAVGFDDEIARLFQQEGVLSGVAEITEAARDMYEWRNRDDEVLLRLDWSIPGPAGRSLANMFSQPELQSVLDRHVRRHDRVALHLGWRLDDLQQDEQHVELRIRRGEIAAPGDWTPTEEVRTISARYVIGADGANSTVGGLLGIEHDDLGFRFDWLIIDVKPHEQREWSPLNWQLCDPARPTAIVSGGPGRRRWEFMALEGESMDDLNTTETAWRLLEPWGRTPENTTLERHAVYTFKASWTKEWRRGRVLLAGDAAHLMPPFAGQGMCGGLRDVANLVWKLDLVLSGRSSDALLDTYGTERSPHIQSFVHLSMALGQITCVLDQEAAAERDRRMIAGDGDPAKVLPEGPPPRLGPGALTEQALAGLPMPQGRVTLDGRTGLLDELVAPGFLVLACRAGAVDALVRDPPDVLQDLGFRILAVGERAVDIDGIYGAFFESNRATAVVVRPDNYIYGLAGAADELRALLDRLGRDLRLARASDP